MWHTGRSVSAAQGDILTFRADRPDRGADVAVEPFDWSDVADVNGRKRSTSAPESSGQDVMSDPFAPAIFMEETFVSRVWLDRIGDSDGRSSPAWMAAASEPEQGCGAVAPLKWRDADPVMRLSGSSRSIFNATGAAAPRRFEA